MASEDLTNIVKSDETPFQIFVKTTEDGTITTDQTSTEQYIYTITMCLPLPDDHQNDAWVAASEEVQQAWIEQYTTLNPSEQVSIDLPTDCTLKAELFDYQFLVLYAKEISSIKAIDLELAMVIDHTDDIICSLYEFIQGYNPYYVELPSQRWGRDYPNLYLSNQVLKVI